MKPRKTPPDGIVAGEVKPNFAVQFRVWWAVIWRVVLALLLLGMVVQYGLRDLLQLPRYYMLKAHDAVMLLLFPITFWAAGSVVNKTFGRYRLALIDTQPEPVSSPKPSDNKLDNKQKKPNKRNKKPEDVATQPNENNT